MHDERSVAITDEDLKSVYLLTLILCALNSAKMCCVTNHSRSLIGLLYLKMFFQKMNFFHASTQNHFCICPVICPSDNIIITIYVLGAGLTARYCFKSISNKENHIKYGNRRRNNRSSTQLKFAQTDKVRFYECLKGVNNIF